MLRRHSTTEAISASPITGAPKTSRLFARANRCAARNCGQIVFLQRGWVSASQRSAFHRICEPLSESLCVLIVIDFCERRSRGSRDRALGYTSEERTKFRIGYLRLQLRYVPASLRDADRSRRWMPFTVSHAAAVLPFRKLNLVWSAFIVGSMAPDFPYIVGNADYRSTWATASRACWTSRFPPLLVALWLFHNVIKRPVVGLLPVRLPARLRGRAG